MASPDGQGYSCSRLKPDKHGWLLLSVAHELGTPLNSVLGYAQLLGQEEPPEKAHRHVKTIETQVRRMASIVQYYLERDHVSINELIRETLLLLKPVFAKKSVHVIAELAEELPSLTAHSGSLQRVLINLLNNAMDAVDEEGRVKIAPRMTQATEHHRSGIVIEITDTGAGISPDLLPRMFDLFMTTKTRGKGTGLGLAVCQEIVKEHGGKLEISSQAQEDTRVKILLPTDTGEETSRSVSTGMKS
ncbi:MAG: sensor histidine kinase [Candidatus Binatia bacterium]